MKIGARALLAAKLIVTAALCAWIVLHVDVRAFGRTLLACDVWLLALVLGIRVLGLVLSAAKWRELLRIHDLAFRLSDLTRWYLVAMFLNNFLPTSIGGDGYRIYRTFGNRRGNAYAVLAVGLERVTGLAMMIAIGASAALALYLIRGDTVARSVLILVGIGGSAGIALLALGRFSRPDRWLPAKLAARVRDLPRAVVEDFRKSPGRLAVVLLISAVFHVNKALVYWLLLRAVGADAGLLEVAVAALAAELAGLAPVALGGLGVIEGAFVLITGHYGVPPEQGLAAAVLWRALLLPLTLGGAICYALDGGRRSLDGEVVATSS